MARSKKCLKFTSLFLALAVFVNSVCSSPLPVESDAIDLTHNSREGKHLRHRGGYHGNHLSYHHYRGGGGGSRYGGGGGGGGGGGAGEGGGGGGGFYSHKGKYRD